MIEWDEERDCFVCKVCHRTWLIGEDPDFCTTCFPVPGWAATIHILVCGNSESEAQDAISELLTGAIEDPGSSYIIDWGYARAFGHLLGPHPFGPIYLDKYREGDFLRRMGGDYD